MDWKQEDENGVLCTYETCAHRERERMLEMYGSWYG